MIIELSKSNRKDKKWKVKVKNKNIHFGASGYGDYTIWNKEKGKEFADKKKKAYLARHKVNENWNKSGIDTSGFWARWLIWNKPSLNASIKDIENRFNVNIIKK
jgi:hypothetical protein